MKLMGDKKIENTDVVHATHLYSVKFIPESVKMIIFEDSDSVCCD